MNDRNPQPLNESPLMLMTTMLGAFADAMNLHHLRAELYGESAGIDIVPTRRVAEPLSRSMPPARAERSSSDHQFGLQTAPFDASARPGRM